MKTGLRRTAVLGQGVKSQPVLPAATRTSSVVVVARQQEPPRRVPKSQKQLQQEKQPRRLPDSGFFAEADPSAEVYSPMGGKNLDFTKRSSSRYDSDFIWNTNWQDKLNYEESLERARAAEEAQAPVQDSGFLSFSRVSELNSIKADLSEQLRRRQQDAQEASTSAPASQAARPRATYSVPPTKGEQRRWDRTSKFGRKVVAPTPPSPVEEQRLAAVRAAESEQFARLRAETQNWTLATAAAGCAAADFFYTSDIAISYAFGALGGVVYLRMLNRSLEGSGSFNPSAAMSQPRLLIPVILALGLNRWNTLAAGETGVTLQLLPILLGFFTYKVAVIARQSLVLFGELTESAKGADADGGVESAADADLQTEAVRVDRAFTKRILTR
ncbi:hypothetical protein WJX72_006729 [[Myrmecia] bisecta]|uniref:CGL160/ATPI domain-containing protein n=1 Tax=[Myrmecia] bisecta TaxID=41462 RepID=A0AAW1QAN6_9CHLO